MQQILNVLEFCHELRLCLGQLIRANVGITLEQGITLTVLHQAGGRLTITGLAEQLNRASHTITSRVNGLEKRGFVIRLTEASGDGRKVWVGITDDGVKRVMMLREATDMLIESMISLVAAIPVSSAQDGRDSRLDVLKLIFADQEEVI